MRPIVITLLIILLAAFIFWMVLKAAQATRDEKRARELHEIEKNRRIISGNYSADEIRTWDDEFSEQWSKSNSGRKT